MSLYSKQIINKQNAVEIQHNKANSQKNQQNWNYDQKILIQKI